MALGQLPAAPSGSCSANQRSAASMKPGGVRDGSSGALGPFAITVGAAPAAPPCRSGGISSTRFRIDRRSLRHVGELQRVVGVERPPTLWLLLVLCFRRSPLQPASSSARAMIAKTRIGCPLHPQGRKAYASMLTGTLRRARKAPVRPRARSHAAPPRNNAPAALRPKHPPSGVCRRYHRRLSPSASVARSGRHLGCKLGSAFQPHHTHMHARLPMAV